MAIFPRLDLRQSQSLVMTPQLQQAIKLLQLSNIELSAYVEDELLRNPMLEREENGPDGADGANPGESTGNGNDAGDDSGEGGADDGFGDEAASPDMVELAATETLPSDNDGPLDIDNEAVWTEDGPSDGAMENGADRLEPIHYERMGDGSGGRTDFADQGHSLEATISDQPTLRDHLTEQLVVDIADPIDRLLGMQLIESLDESGWLSESLDQIGEKLNCSVDRVERVLRGCFRD